MEVLNRAYNGLRGFVDEFANSTTGSDTAPRKMENRKAWYAEWDDNYVYDILNTNFARNLLRKLADSCYGRQVDEIIDCATELVSTAYPMSFEVFRLCCETLGMYNPPKVYVTGKLKGINALSLEVHLKQYILISPSSTVRLTPYEQAFLYGHELGHHQQGNLICHTVNGLLNSLNRINELFGYVIPDTIEIPFKRWCRMSEFNADRAGYLCCKDTDSINSLFLKAIPYKKCSNVDAYKELSYGHPLLSARIRELNNYIKMLG